jgi:hypothetical protein
MKSLAVAALSLAALWAPSAGAQDAACTAKAQKLFQNQLPPLTACSLDATAGAARGASAGRKVYYQFNIAGAGFKGVIQVSTDGHYNPGSLKTFAELACGCSVGGAEPQPVANGLRKLALPGLPPVLIAIDGGNPSQPTWRFGMGDEAVIARLWAAFVKDRRAWTAALQ